MVEDSEIQHLISWSGNGELFRVYNPTTFSRNVLPQYFKHNNWQSFVRQLNSKSYGGEITLYCWNWIRDWLCAANMKEKEGEGEKERWTKGAKCKSNICWSDYRLYSNGCLWILVYGFNKVNDMIHSNLKNENQTWEFRHPHFRQGCIDDLRNIKRKSVRSLRATAPLPPSSATDQDNKADKYHREYNMIEDRLNYITRGHSAMQEEFSSLRFVVARQQEVSGRLLTLALVVIAAWTLQDCKNNTYC